MRVIAIETTGSSLSVAATADNILLAEYFWNTDKRHSEELIPMIKNMIDSLGWELRMVDRIAVSVGPGSFTGIRVGLVCANAFSQNTGIPITGIDSLSLLSGAVPSSDCKVIPLIDALRNEVFVRKGKKIEIQPIAVAAKNIKKIKGRVIIVGSAVKTYGATLKKILGKKAIFAPENFNYPRAGTLALLAGKIGKLSRKSLEPLYIRRSWAEEKR